MLYIAHMKFLKWNVNITVVSESTVFNYSLFKENVYQKCLSVSGISIIPSSVHLNTRFQVNRLNSYGFHSIL